MLRHLLILPDGTEVFSGASGAAVVNVKVTQAVNDGQQLSPGAACAAMLEATLLDPPPIRAGDRLTLYAVDTGGNRRQVGVFLAEKPEQRGAHTVHLIAYDRLTLLDRDLTGWLAGLNSWPYSLQTFAHMVCDACGLTLHSGELPNGDFPVERFTADGVTGRQLMMWVGQASGRFCRATPLGDAELAWYVPVDIKVGPSLTPTTDTGDGQDGGVRQYCFQGSTRLGDYTVAPIEKVQLRRDEQDVGTVFPPDDPEEKNTFCITGNPLLAAGSAQTLPPVAQTLYESLKELTYTPGTCKLPSHPAIEPGSILRLTDPAGKEHTFYVMTVERSGRSQTLTATGQQRRSSATAFNQATYAPLTGKVLRLRTDVDGILAENADTAGRVSRLELDLGGIRAQTQSQQTEADALRTQLTALEQTAEKMSATVRSITENGASRVENAFGLTIDGSAVEIRRSGSDMANRLDEQGMYIVRGAGTGSETTMLRADANGVLATDVSVRNYLRIGDHARFEDYTDGADHRRTACYYIGE